MILICDNCHNIFDSDILEKFPVSPENPLPQYCPFCGADSVTYTVSTGNVHMKRTLPAVRHTSFSEHNTYQQTILNVLGSIPRDEISKKAKKKIEEALTLISSFADELSDDEYNMLLIFAFLYGRSSDVRLYLKPLLGLDRFYPSSRGRSADPQYDSERVYEKATKLFRSIVTGPNHDPDSLTSDARYVASFMRQSDAMPAKKTTASVYHAIINNISIETLCESPGKVYLNAIRELIDLCG